MFSKHRPTYIFLVHVSSNDQLGTKSFWYMWPSLRLENLHKSHFTAVCVPSPVKEEYVLSINTLIRPRFNCVLTRTLVLGTQICRKESNNERTHVYQELRFPLVLYCLSERLVSHYSPNQTLCGFWIIRIGFYRLLFDYWQIIVRLAEGRTHVVPFCITWTLTFALSRRPLQ